MLHVDLSTTDVDYADPALSYFLPMWQIEYASCANLVNYPDAEGPAGAHLVPELAASMPTVSADGLRYTFTIRPGFGFSPPINRDVTAQDVKYTFDRLANRTVYSSPAYPFFSDIVGVDDADQSSVSGVVADGNKVQITLTRPASDFLSRLAMRFFCVVPEGTPMLASGVNTPTTAGPYYISARTPGQSIDLVRNPNYGGSRPAYFDQIHYDVLTNPDTAYLAIKAGTVDYDASGAPGSADGDLWTNYGPGSSKAAAGKQQYFVNPTMGTNYFALNTSRADMFGKVELRRAVNYLIDRAALVASQGGHAGAATDQMLPPNLPGFIDGNLYPLDGPDLATAADLIAEAGGIPPRTVVIYEGASDARHSRGEILKKNLEDAGFTVDLQFFSTGDMYRKCGTKGEPFDICDVGWLADYPDPFDFLDVLFNGTRIHDTNNTNYSYFNDTNFNNSLGAAAALAGEARYSAYGNLDLELMSDHAPAAPWINTDSRDFLSERIGCVKYQPVSGIDVAGLCLRPEISVAAPASTPEGAGGSHAVAFTVSLSNAEPDALTVHYATGDGTATAGQDYLAASGSLTFDPGQITKTVSVQVLGDTTDEPDEPFNVELSDASKGTVVNSAMVTILDDDAPPPPPPPPPPPAPPAPAPTCVVPNVTLQPLASAEAALLANRCSPGILLYRFSSRVRKGRVISQAVSPATQLPANSTVDLVVSKGQAPPPKVTLCYRHHTLKVTKKVAKKLRKHGARLGACKKTRR